MRKYADLTLLISGKKIDLPGQVKQVICVYEKVILLLYSDGLTHRTRPHANGNIICLDEHGNWLWEIEHRQPTYDEHPGGAFNPFHRIEVEFTTKPRMYAWNGDFRVEVDLDTGMWLKTDFTK